VTDSLCQPPGMLPPLNWRLEGWLRVDNEARLSDARRHVCHVGCAVGSPDPDVVIADRRMNPGEG
jgi:hypothetical protein